MRVFIWPNFKKKDTGEGGIRRVVEAQYRWLPEYGVELVSSAKEADLINVHADEFETDKPVAASLHGLYWYGYDWENWCYEANQRLIRVAKRAQSVSVPSQWVRHSLARGMLLDPFVLMHGVEAEEWTGGVNEGYVFWGKTRPDPICDPKPLAELAALAPNQTFVTTFQAAAQPNVKTTGRLSYAETKQYIQNAAVYLGTVRETGGITCLEAMASGVPVLGYNWGANSEIIKHKVTGYLVDPDDREGLLEGLAYCLEHRQRLGEAAREYVYDYHQWKDRIQDYIPFFQAALDNSIFPVRVSVVVTAYNLEQYLPGCLDSILAQEMRDWECIIVDDCSPDRCGEIADDYAHRDSRFRVIHNSTNRYLAEARNIGLRSARGELLVSLDADDQLSPTTLRLLVEAADRHPDYDIFTGGFELVEPTGERWRSGWPTDNPSFEQQISRRNQVPYSSLVRRWVWERTGGYRRRHRTAEDADFWTRAMSYGARPAKVTNEPTLIYANRPGSMSRSVEMIDWTAWYPWSKIIEMTPFGAAAATDNKQYSQFAHAYSPPAVSVIIPCGPGHEIYLQDVLDSLVAQTFLNWEVIIVNDTGRPWMDDVGKITNHYLAGFPFVNVIDGVPGENKGPGWARNQGISAARAPLVVLFDADDFMQPLMLDALIKTHEETGRWVYCDWYDQDGARKEAQPWDGDKLCTKMLGPVTGLYTKEMWNAAQFDEHTEVWEDYDWQLSLYEHGFCGVRVAMPLFTYRYQTGKRREDNFARQQEALQYIQSRHRRLLKDEEFKMTCRSCGGFRVAPSVEVSLSSAAGASGDMVLLEYIGPQTQTMHIRSRVKPRIQYHFGGVPGSNDRQFFVYVGDVEWLTSMPFFAKKQTTKASLEISEPPAVMTAATIDPSPHDDPITDLNLDGEIVTALRKAGLETIGQVRKLSPTDLSAIKHMGRARVRKVLDAIASYA